MRSQGGLEQFKYTILKTVEADYDQDNRVDTKMFMDIVAAHRNGV